MVNEFVNGVKSMVNEFVILVIDDFLHIVHIWL
jgi:hypothetical protein